MVNLGRPLAQTDAKLLTVLNFRPFLIDVDTDFCDLMGNKTKNQILGDILIPLVMPKSNWNHSCPYKALILQNFVFDSAMVSLFPAPTGYYRLNTRIYNPKTNETIMQAHLYISIYQKY